MSKPLCFNCGVSGHSYANYPMEKNEVLRNVGRNARGELKDIKKDEERGMVTRTCVFKMTME